jgi:hypothetical protein
VCDIAAGEQCAFGECVLQDSERKRAVRKSVHCVWLERAQGWSVSRSDQCAVEGIAEGRTVRLAVQ